LGNCLTDSLDRIVRVGQSVLPCSVEPAQTAGVPDAERAAVIVDELKAVLPVRGGINSPQLPLQSDGVGFGNPAGHDAPPTRASRRRAVWPRCVSSAANRRSHSTDSAGTLVSCP